MIKYIFLFTLLAIQVIGLKAQSSTILNEGVSKEIHLTTQTNESINYNTNLLQILFGSSNVDLATSKLSYKAKEYHRITQRGTKTNLSISIGNLILQGDHFYKKFAINDLLIPNEISFTYHWVDSSGNEIESNKLLNQKFKSGAELFSSSKINNTKAVGSKLYLSNVHLIYCKTNFKKFDSFVNSVDNYYDADARLNMINQELDKIKLDSIELLNASYEITLNNIKYFNQIKSQRLNSTLSLASNDPIGFKSYLGKTQVKNRGLKTNLEYVTKNMHETYYKKGIDWLAWNDKNKAKSFFLKSINKKNSYAPPFLELAKLDFESNNFQAALDTCSSIIQAKKPDNDTRYNTLKLAEKVILIYLDSTKILVNNHHYEAAISKLNFCKTYVNNTEGMRNFPEFTEIETEVFKGYYKILATQAQSLIDEKELAKANKCIDSLTNFRLANKQNYIEPVQEEILYGNLYQAWLNSAQNYLNKSITDSAIHALTKAKIICSKNDFIKCSEELSLLIFKAYTANYQELIIKAENALLDELADSAIVLLNIAEKQQIAYNLDYIEKSDTLYIQAKQLKYKGLINEGNYALNGGDGKQSLAYYQEAIEISNSVEILKDSSLNTKTANAASAYIISICSNCETFIKSMQIDKARAGFHKAKHIEKQYSLAKRTDVKEAIDKIAELLNEGECALIQHDFNIQFSTAKKFVDKLDFNNAQKAISNAQDFIKNKKECNIDASELKTLSQEIHGISEYSIELNRIEQLITAKKNNKAIHAYMALTTYYNDSVINNYGIAHNELFDYINRHENNDLLNFAASFYTNEGEPDKALKLLNELYRRNYIASWSQESQLLLGAYFAKVDFESDSETDPKYKISNYTNDLPWFKYLKKSYLKQWKQATTN